VGWYTNVTLFGIFCLLWVMFVLALQAHWLMLRTPGPDKWGRAGKGERCLWWHSQNLNEKGYSRVGSKWRAGRCWLHCGGRLCYQAEWHLFYWGTLNVGFRFDSDGDEILFSLCLPGLCRLYFGVEGLRWGLGWGWLPEGRECAIKVHDWCLWLNPWTRLDEWHSNDPWWSKGVVIRLGDLLFGEVMHSSKLLSSGEVWIPMPEGCYRATYTVEGHVWSWPRYPIRFRVYYCFDIPGGIPHEGKGENSWDCGEDATEGITLCADNLEEAVGKVVGSVLATRKRYGGEQTHRALGIHRVNGTP
jgi:hypothetical protein